MASLIREIGGSINSTSSTGSVSVQGMENIAKRKKIKIAFNLKTGMVFYQGKYMKCISQEKGEA